MTDLLYELFDEYAVRYSRGELPDPGDYLERAGDEAGRLGAMLDLFLQWAPPPSPDETAVELMQAWLAGEPPLRDLRIRRGLRVDELVRGLAGALDIDVAKNSKLKRYWQQLERGSLESARVDRRVFDALAALLKAPSSSLLAAYAALPREQLLGSAAPAYRADEGQASDKMAAYSRALARSAGEEWDEVDELFLGKRRA